MIQASISYVKIPQRHNRTQIRMLRQENYQNGEKHEIVNTKHNIINSMSET